MCAFTDVFPNPNPLHITIKNKLYYLYDEYCIDPECECYHVHISLILLDEANMKHQVYIKSNYSIQENSFKFINKSCSKEQYQEAIDYIKNNSELIKIIKDRYFMMKDTGAVMIHDELIDEENDEILKVLFKKRYKSKTFSTLNHKYPMTS